MSCRWRSTISTLIQDLMILHALRNAILLWMQVALELFCTEQTVAIEYFEKLYSNSPFEERQNLWRDFLLASFFDIFSLLLNHFCPSMTMLCSGICYCKSDCRLWSVTFVHPSHGLKLSAIFLCCFVPASVQNFTEIVPAEPLCGRRWT